MFRRERSAVELRVLQPESARRPAVKPALVPLFSARAGALYTLSSVTFSRQLGVRGRSVSPDLGSAAPRGCAHLFSRRPMWRAGVVYEEALALQRRSRKRSARTPEMS